MNAYVDNMITLFINRGCSVASGMITHVQDVQCRYGMSKMPYINAKIAVEPVKKHA